VEEIAITAAFHGTSTQAAHAARTGRAIIEYNGARAQSSLC
jgi:hypothetical protein